MILLLHAYHLSHGFICNYAKHGKNAAIEPEEEAIVEIPMDLPVEWLTKSNRENREVEFHYVFADYAKDPHADYIIKMKAQHVLVTNKIAVTFTVERTKVLAEGEAFKPLHARQKQKYTVVHQFNQHPLAALDNADPSD